MENVVSLAIMAGTACRRFRRAQFRFGIIEDTSSRPDYTKWAEPAPVQFTRLSSMPYLLANAPSG
jgi:hypothetical protein